MKTQYRNEAEKLLKSEISEHYLYHYIDEKIIISSICYTIIGITFSEIEDARTIQVKEAGIANKSLLEWRLKKRGIE
jgi:hypothetical protein